MIEDFKSRKKLFSRDHSKSPCLFIKSSLVRLVTARLNLLREGAPEELKKFILDCNTHEVLSICVIIFAPYATPGWAPTGIGKENGDFLIQLFKSDLEQRCLSEEKSGSDNEKSSAQTILSIMATATNAIDKSGSALTGKVGIREPEESKATPLPKGKGYELPSPVIWMGLAIAIVAALISWWVYSKHSPFKILGTPQSTMPNPFASSPLRS